MQTERLLNRALFALVIFCAGITGAQSDESFQPGDKVQVNNFGKWSDGEVVRDVAAGFVLVKFKDPEFDTFVTAPFGPGDIRKISADLKVEPADKYRSWTSFDGKFKVEAMFDSRKGPNVMLKRKSDGTFISVEIAKLSQQDQNYLASLKQTNHADQEAANPFAKEVPKTDRQDKELESKVEKPLSKREQQRQRSLERSRSGTNRGPTNDPSRTSEPTGNRTPDRTTEHGRNRASACSQDRTLARPGTQMRDRTETPSSPESLEREPSKLSRNPIDRSRENESAPKFSSVDSQPNFGGVNEIVDGNFGFSVTVPDGMTEYSVPKNDGDTLYRYMESDAGSGDLGTVFQIQRLHGSIDPDERLSEAEFPETPGVEMTLEEIEWNGLTLDVMRNEEMMENILYVTYVVQFPLPGEAVQLQLGGIRVMDDITRASFRNAVASFKNLKPMTHVAPEKKRSTQERIARIGSAIVLFGLFLGFVAVIVGIIVNQSRKSKLKG